MRSAHEGGRGAEPFGIGQQVGFQGYLWSGGVHWGQAQLSARSPCDRRGGRKRPRPPQDAMSGRLQLPGRGGAGPHLAAAPALSTDSGSGVQELPEVEELKRTCARSSLSGLHARGIPGVAEAPVLGKMPCLPPAFSAPNPFGKSFKPRSQSG